MSDFQLKQPTCDQKLVEQHLFVRIEGGGNDGVLSRKHFVPLYLTKASSRTLCVAPLVAMRGKVTWPTVEQRTEGWVRSVRASLTTADAPMTNRG